MMIISGVALMQTVTVALSKTQKGEKMAEDDNNKEKQVGSENNADGKENGGKENANDKNKENQKSEAEILKEEIKTLKAESSGKDKKIQEILDSIKKEKETKDLESKTADEKLTVYEQKLKTFEQKEAFRKSFGNEGLNPDEFYEIVNEQDPEKQAKKFAELLKKQTDASALKAVEDFKKEELKKIPSEPKPKDKTDTTKNPNVIQKKWNRFKSQ